MRPQAVNKLYSFDGDNCGVAKISFFNQRLITANINPGEDGYAF